MLSVCKLCFFLFFPTLTSRHKSKQTKPHTKKGHQTSDQLLWESALAKKKIATPKMSDWCLQLVSMSPCVSNKTRGPWMHEADGETVAIEHKSYSQQGSRLCKRLSWCCVRGSEARNKLKCCVIIPLLLKDPDEKEIHLRWTFCLCKTHICPSSSSSVVQLYTLKGPILCQIHLANVLQWCVPLHLEVGFSDFMTFDIIMNEPL